MRTQLQIAQWIVGRGGYYLLTVKASQKTLHRVLRDLTWRDVPAVSSVEAGHGRRSRCTLEAADAPAWIDFPGAAQMIRVRRTRTTTKRKGGNGKGRSVEVVHPGPLPAYDPGPVRAGRCLGPGALDDGEPAPPGTRRGLRPGIASSCAPATARGSWPRCNLAISLIRLFRGPRSVHRRRHQIPGKTLKTSHQANKPTNHLNRLRRPPANVSRGLKSACDFWLTWRMR